MIKKIIVIPFICFIYAQAQNEAVKIAESERLWTGVAVSREGRIFVCFPRWFADHSISVAEIDEKGDISAFPDKQCNEWSAGAPAEDHFICVQSVYIDSKNKLWILDTGSYRGKMVERGAKLIQVDLSSNKINQTIFFPRDIIPEGSYLNDIRIDCSKNTGYITDSGLGAIILVDVNTRTFRRLLSDHKSTRSEGCEITIDGIEWKTAHGANPEIHSDGIALSPGGEYLYYQALTAKTLYRIKTEYIHDNFLSETELQSKVEKVGEFGPADGIEFDNEGNLYLTSIVDNSIKVLTSETELKILSRSSDFKWPDSISICGNGLFFTCSKIHLVGKTDEPYTLFKITLRDR